MVTTKKIASSGIHCTLGNEGTNATFPLGSTMISIVNRCIRRNTIFR